MTVAVEVLSEWATAVCQLASASKEEGTLSAMLRASDAHMRYTFNALQTIAGLEKDILGHKKELLERDETIRDKEKRIYDLKKKNQELEKFKFVLDYKIRELKRQAEPKDEQISDMRDTIKVSSFWFKLWSMSCGSLCCK